MTRNREVYEEHQAIHVIYGGKAFKISRDVYGQVVYLKAEEWMNESGSQNQGWVTRHYWKELKK